MDNAENKAGDNANQPTELELRECVTEYMGIKPFYEEDDTEKRWPTYIPSGKPRRTHMIDSRPVPNYTSEISAWFDERGVHVKLLEKGDHLDFAWRLSDIASIGMPYTCMTSEESWRDQTATAKQRSIALYRMIEERKITAAKPNV